MKSWHAESTKRPLVRFCDYRIPKTRLLGRTVGLLAIVAMALRAQSRIPFLTAQNAPESAANEQPNGRARNRPNNSRAGSQAASSCLGATNSTEELGASERADELATSQKKPHPTYTAARIDGIEAAELPPSAMSNLVEDVSSLFANQRFGCPRGGEQLPAERGLTDLAKSAYAAADRAMKQYSTAGVDLVTEIADPIPVVVDENKIRLALDQLLAIALRSSDAKEIVRLRIWSNCTGIHLMVDNTAPSQSFASGLSKLDRRPDHKMERLPQEPERERTFPELVVLVEALGGSVTSYGPKSGYWAVHVLLHIHSQSAGSAAMPLGVPESLTTDSLFSISGS